MKWYPRTEVPPREGHFILARFEGDKLKDLQIGRVQFFEGEFQIWCNDMLACYHSKFIPEKFTHWAYEDEYWKLLESQRDF